MIKLINNIIDVNDIPETVEKRFKFKNHVIDVYFLHDRSEVYISHLSEQLNDLTDHCEWGPHSYRFRKNEKKFKLEGKIWWALGNHEFAKVIAK